MTETSPVALITACRAGDTAAWDQLLERYGRLIWSVTQRLGLRDSEAKEVFQRTWLAILEGINELRDPERVAGWIISITRNQSYLLFSERRRNRREVALEEVDSDGFEPAVPAGVDEELDRLELSVAMRDALRALDDRCRTLLELLFLEEPRPDYEQISELLGLAVGSIGPTRARCLKKLEKKLDRAFLRSKH